MASIIKATVADFKRLANIGATAFIESHGHSAPLEVIDMFVKQKFNDEACKDELGNSNNIYHIIYNGTEPAGYSKIIFNSTHPLISTNNTTKLDRIYLLKKYYNLQLGAKLFEHSLQLSTQNNQSGMWLYVWTENKRAIKFYEKNKFKIIGSHDYKLTAEYSNPNHLMFLEY